MVLFVALLTGLLAGGLTVTDQGRASAASARAEVVIDEMTPAVLPDTELIEVTGRVTNRGELPLENVKAFFWFSPTRTPLTSRAQIAETADGANTDWQGRLTQFPEADDDVTASLAPGDTAKFHLRVPIELLEVTEKGVYEAGVDVRGTPPGWDQRYTGIERNFLPWMPKDDRLTPVEVSFLAPLTGRSNLVGGELLLDDEESDAYAPDGRLSRLLDLGEKYDDLTYLVDPAVLQQAEVMADGYDTLPSWERAETGADDAATWLERANGLLAARDSLLLPYADPDVSALTHNDLDDEFGRALEESERVNSEQATSGALTWPGSGYADNATLESVVEHGGSTVLLTNNALPELPDDGTSPVASLVTPAGGLTALVADPTLTAPDPREPADTMAVRQRFLAETALMAIQGGSPTEQRRVVAAFPRSWSPRPSDEELLDTTRTMPWLRSISGSAVLSESPAAYGGPTSYPKSQRRAELDGAVIDGLRTLRQTTRTYLDMLVDKDETTRRLQLSQLRAASVGWRDAEQRAGSLISEMNGVVDDQIDQVELEPRQPVTLSSDTGRFPLTVSNDGSHAVRVRVRVEVLRERSDGRLSFKKIQQIRVDEDRKQTVSVEAHAYGGEVIRVEAKLSTPNGTELPSSQPFDVRVSAYGQVGWVVIGLGAGLLFVAAGLRVIRRIRSALGKRGGKGDEGDTVARSEPREPTRA